MERYSGLRRPSETFEGPSAARTGLSFMRCEGVGRLAFAAALVVSACSADPGAAAPSTQATTPTVPATPDPALNAGTAAPTSSVDTPGEADYPEDVYPYEERPAGRPETLDLTHYSMSGPTPVQGFGTIVLLDSGDPPQRSEIVAYWGGIDGRTSQFSVAVGDRFQIDGFVFEMTASAQDSASFDVWTPEQVEGLAEVRQRRFPEGVGPVDRRPDVEPVTVSVSPDGGPTDIEGVATIELFGSDDPPRLSGAWLWWGQANQYDGPIRLTAGDRFAFDGSVLEVVEASPSGITLDVWSAERLGNQRALAPTTIPTAPASREFPDGVRQVAERPSGDLLSSSLIPSHTSLSIPGFGHVDLEKGHHPPELSDLRILRDRGEPREVHVLVTRGDLFEVDGFVFEIVAISETSALVDVWFPEQQSRSLDDSGEYPDGVRAVDQRPTAEPISDTFSSGGAPKDVSGFGRISFVATLDPPFLSPVTIWWGEGLQQRSEFYVTKGDRFEIDGYVFEVTAISVDGADFDIWSPEQLGSP